MIWILWLGIIATLFIFAFVRYEPGSEAREGSIIATICLIVFFSIAFGIACGSLGNNNTNAYEALFRYSAYGDPAQLIRYNEEVSRSAAKEKIAWLTWPAWAPIDSNLEVIQP